jgi:type IV pilus assembly protein PilQ
VKTATVLAVFFLALTLPRTARAVESGLDRGPLVTIESSGVAVVALVRSLAYEHGLNLVIEGGGAKTARDAADGALDDAVDDAVDDKVTISVRDVPLWDVIDPLLKDHGLERHVLPGPIHIVRPMDPRLRAEFDMRVRVFPLRYLDAQGALDRVKGVLTAGATASAEPLTRAVVVKDIPLGIARAEALLAGIDTRPRQVVIEARIVEVESGYGRELGVAWGLAHERVSSDVLGGLGTVGSGAGVSLPATSDGGLSLSFGLLSDELTVDLTLSALEETGKARVVSRPSVLVRDGQQAAISDGVELLIPTSSAQTVIQTGGTTQAGPIPATQTFRAMLGLTVTPSVIDGREISLDIAAERDEFDFDTEVEGYPAKRTRSARTSLIVRDGETVVMGGISASAESESNQDVPWLSRLPVLGKLFSHRTRKRADREVLIFLTPRIARDPV